MVKRIEHTIKCKGDKRNIVCSGVKSWQQWLSQYSFLLKPTLIFSAIFFISLFALMRANFNYFDDYGRINEGYQYWEQFGRYISNTTSAIIHTNTFLSDISPLTQGIACLIMGLTSAIVVYVITGKKEFKFYHYLAGIPIGLSPYFLECYSYKFDAPYMALSVLASVVSFLFLNSRHKAVFPAVAFCSALAMCMTYQASNGIFFILLLLIELKQLLLSKLKLRKSFLDFLKLFLMRAIPYLAGMLCFKLFLMPSYDGGYASTTLPPLLEIPTTFLNNLQRYYEFIWSDFNMVWTILVALTLLAFVFAAVRFARCNKFIAIMAVILFLVCVGLGSFGIYPALETPLFSAHAMYGITVAFGFICIATVELARTSYIRLLRIPVFLISWCFVVYAFIYGNSLSQQLEYANFRLEQTLTTINQNDLISSQDMIISVKNDPDFAPAIQSNIAHYPILGRTIYKVYYAFDVWGTYKLLNYYDLSNGVKIGEEVVSAEDNPCSQHDECELIETYYDNIYYNEEAILIEIKR